MSDLYAEYIADSFRKVGVMKSNGEPDLYTAGEKAHLTVLAARAITAVSRGKSTTKIDRAIDNVRSKALAREQVEEQARADARVERDARRMKPVYERAKKREANRWFA